MSVRPRIVPHVVQHSTLGKARYLRKPFVPTTDALPLCRRGCLSGGSGSGPPNAPPPPPTHAPIFDPQTCAREEQQFVCLHSGADGTSMPR